MDKCTHTYINGVCTGCNKSILELETGYTHATIKDRGIQNAIERAYLLTDIEWTTCASMPGLTKRSIITPFEPRVTYRGVPYSGVTANDCYIGLNVSLESFLTALKNPNSVLYTENLQSTNPKAATYFGTVCSKFVQYVLDVPGSFNTNNIVNIPGMATIALPGEFTMDEIKVGDVVVDVKKHTTICTDVIYDANGKVAFVEISEAVYPTVRRRLWNYEEFYKRFENYRLCRYGHITSTPPAPEVNLKSEYALMPRFGDKYNYKQSSSDAVVDVLIDGYYKAVTLKDGVIVNETLLNGAKTFAFDRSAPGYIEMYLEKDDGTRSDSVYACVVSSSVSATDITRFSEGKLRVKFEGSSGTPLYVQVGNAHVIFCNVKECQDTAELSFDVSKVASLRARVAYQNEYAIYISDWFPFSDKLNTSTDPLLSQADFWDSFTLTPSSHIPRVVEGKADYYSYTQIPVEENLTYYSFGATRMWFLDKYRRPISTYNVSKDSEVKYQFTTPEGTVYASISYSANVVKKGTESIQIVHSCENSAQMNTK